MKILYGICGLGRGHAMRQLPVLEQLVARGDRVMIFAYGESLAFFRPWGQLRGVPVEEVAVPFVVGDAGGIDLEATRLHPANQRDFEAVNGPAKEAVRAYLGTPDLVVSDYEPIAAEVAYATDTPLVTLDQQSKFLLDDSKLPAVLGGFTPLDEVARLRHFFPTAARRLACSFFTVEGTGDVTIIAPTLRNAVLDLKVAPSPAPTLAVYATTTNGGLDMENLLAVLGRFPEVRFEVFSHYKAPKLPSHIRLHVPEEKAFLEVLGRAWGIITGAGHSLLSEAMHLALPALVIPTAIYEQRLNAHVIDAHGFGLATPHLTHDDVAAFLAGLAGYRAAITADTRVLMGGDGVQAALACLDGLT